ncbi:hypothetical protein RND81_13G173300 [Saponaria officinalis]|uniref:C3H1-type domain-containing protein n=1 Tax=Saponaria officinalis TaxID=3572 RepID=A0AAW1GYV3_SAPOF
MAPVIKELPEQAPPPSTAAVKAEYDSSKRNTDCIYFLASPLTCKKGSECEYRHCESARTNPRDCYYWLNGNCMNPKCAFRHPPLDVLAPPQAGNSVGPSPPVPPSGTPAPSKQAVPCVFFQQGFCLKGDRCPFLHGPFPSASHKIWPNPATTAATEAPAFKKSFGGPQKYTQTRMGFQSLPKVVEAPRQPQAHAVPKVVAAQLVAGDPAGKRYQAPGVIKEIPKSQEIKPSRIDDGSLRSNAARFENQNHRNRRDVKDSLRETSPGFDVLVDDKLRKDEYYHDEDQYVTTRGREGRRIDEFNIGHRDHYNSATGVDLDNYRNKHGYNSCDILQDDYARVQRGASSERPTPRDRRGPYKSESPDYTQNASDLRHRLSKQRRGNGLRSVVSPDYKPTNHHPEDRGYRGSQRDTRSPSRDRSIGSRLQGRIKLPRRSPPVTTRGHVYPDKDNERGRNVGRSSPTRPHVSSHRGRLQDRLGARLQDESNEGRSFRKDSTTDEFAGRKRLLELRGTNRADSKHQQLTDHHSVSGRKLRGTVVASSVGSEGDASFAAPKPLSEILKRKRKAGMTASTSVPNFDSKELKQNENNVDSVTIVTDAAADKGKQVALSSASEQTQGDVQENNQSVIAEGNEDGEISNKKVKLTEDEPSLPNDEKKDAEAEEGLIDGDGEEQGVDEEYDHGDGEYEYEQDDDVEGYDLNELEVDVGDAADGEDFMDEDDGDDFAKKLGVSF